MTRIVEANDAGSNVSGRSSRVLVDLDKIEANVRFFRRTVSPGTAVMAVVKADGYGHGAIEMARAAMRSGASQLAVATVSEGTALRAAGLTAPVLVLGPIDPSEVREAIEHDLGIAIGDRRFVEVVGQVAASLGASRVSLHLKVDTGMRRFGAMPAEAVEVARAAIALPRLDLEGVFTHFAEADGRDDRATSCQAQEFETVLARLADCDIRPPLVHAANSAAALRWRYYDYNMVRIGIAMYGLPPAPGFAVPDALQPALAVVSKVARVIALEAGDGVSYGSTYRSTAPERAALVPIGYADGYPRALSSRGRMAVGGRPAPVLGRVCMDQTVIGLSGIADVIVGERVDVVGGTAPSVDEIASSLGTISYEVVTGLSRRMPRTYVRGTPTALDG